MSNWTERNAKYTLTDGASGFSIAFAGMKFEDADLEAMRPKFEQAAAGIRAIEAGEIKNPDENAKSPISPTGLITRRVRFSIRSRSLPKRFVPARSPVPPAGNSMRWWSTASAGRRSVRS